MLSVDGSTCTPSPLHSSSQQSGQVWNDTAGNRIYAGGGGFYFENSTYYWVGEGPKHYQDLSAGITLYTSTDLGNWTYQGYLLMNTSMPCTEAPGPYRIERPKLFRANDGTYRMFWHHDTASFSIQSVGVATAPSPMGPWTFKSCFRPDGIASFDQTVFADTTFKTAYSVRSAQNKYIAISELNADFTQTTGVISTFSPCAEGQAVLRLPNGTLILAGSHLTGWAPNPAMFLMADRTEMNGAVWRDLGNPSGDATTWHSQSTYLLPVTQPDGSLLIIWCADRWEPNALLTSTYVWLPLLQKNGVWSLPWIDSWSPADYSTFSAAEVAEMTRQGTAAEVSAPRLLRG